MRALLETVLVTGVLWLLRVGRHQDGDVLLLVQLGMWVNLDVLVRAEVAGDDSNVVDGSRWIEVIPLLLGSVVVVLALPSHGDWPIRVISLVLVNVEIVLGWIKVLMAPAGFLDLTAGLLATDKFAFGCRVAQVRVARWRVVAHLRPWIGVRDRLALAALPGKGIRIVVKCLSRYRIQMQSLSLAFCQNSLKGINQVFMISVRFKHFKNWHDENIFFLDKLLKKLDVVGITEVVLGEAINVVHQLVLADGQRALGALVVVDLLLG